MCRGIIPRKESKAIRTLLHLSDLHFGRIDPAVLDPLIEAAWQIRPTVVVISGDFTMDGRVKEFEQAQAFLQKLPKPQISVPGNHDMPFFNIVKRAFVRLDRYKRYITPDLAPYFEDDQIAVLGVNTARVRSLRGGSLNDDQISGIQQRMCETPRRIRVLVTHHPIDLPESYSRRHLVGKARKAMERLAGCIDVLLAGHMHLSHTGHTAARYKIDGHSAIFVQAGTATSTRGRGELNSFNLLHLDNSWIEIHRFSWNAERKLFGDELTDRFEWTGEGWARAAGDPDIANETETGEFEELLATATDVA